MQMTETMKLVFPTYQDLPSMGLYLKHVVAYIEDCTQDLASITITNSMVSNYVKHQLIPHPTKKLYYRDQIAMLLFIVVAKTVLEQQDLRQAVQIQAQTYDLSVAYDYFNAELTNVTEYVRGQRPALAEIGHEQTGEKQMLRNIIMAFAYREYLYRYFHQADNESLSN
ncbi:MAG: DUF1836 domain-containing protein [Limosilactobacillus sp.]|nr:DUF1836 domain-containing protein [Limosilactobacillus sp.]